jgi:hypothetical protein
MRASPLGDRSKRDIGREKKTRRSIGGKNPLRRPREARPENPSTTAHRQHAESNSAEAKNEKIALSCHITGENCREAIPFLTVSFIFTYM